jgi:DNA-binding GntR family transcriptional regulator
LIDYKIQKADAKIAEKLGVAVGANVLYLKRLRSADNVAVSILENWLPTEFTEITEAELNEFGLYQLLRSRGVTIRVAKQRIGARKASTTESNLLDIEKSAALLTMDRTAYDNSGKAVEFGHHCYRPDLYSFEVTLVEK